MAIRDEKLKKTGKFILIETIAIIGLIIILCLKQETVLCLTSPH